LNQPLDLICNLLLLQGLGIGTNLNGPAWSVSAEFMAYLLFPLLIAVAIRGNRVAVAGAAALAFAALAFVASTNPRLGLGSEDVLKGGLRCLSEFTLGILTFRIAQRPPWARWLAQDRTVYTALACCLGLLLLRIDLLVALSFPFLIGSLAKNEDRALRLLSHPALVMLGTISYSLYLIHNPFRPVALHILRTLHPEALATGPALAFALVASLLVIPFAWLTYRAVELPSRTFLNRRFARTVAA
jgi:peptidoglycan/LPS O-acetylase OafA/YrhL